MHRRQTAKVKPITAVINTGLTFESGADAGRVNSVGNDVGSDFPETELVDDWPERLPAEPTFRLHHTHRHTPCLKKCSPPYFVPLYTLNNSAKNKPVLIIFGAQNPEKKLNIRKL